LPKVPELAPALAHPGMPELPPVQYESRLYLPGDWTDAHVDSDDLLPIPRWQDGDPEPPPEKVFLPCPPPAWFRALEDLLALAEAQDKPVTESGRQPAKPVNPYRKKNVNARMLEKMQQDSAAGSEECYGWTCGQWARFLNCSEPSVVATK